MNRRVHVCFYMSAELDKRLRKYLYDRFGGHVHGKLTEVLVEALEEYLSKREA